MENLFAVIAPLLDLILHVDKHLAAFVQAQGPLVYALLFVVVFVETGLVVMPFLPGDSLLFVVGAMGGSGLLDLWIALPVMLAAAFLGDQCNFSLGRWVGPRVFQWPQSRWFNRQAFEQAHAFYEKWGAWTIVAARFLPFIRTFAPFVAGVADMARARFVAFNALGAVLWVLGVGALGAVFGNVPWVQANFEKFIWALILLPGALALLGLLRRQTVDSSD
jgi:membrane-associated protein